MRKVLWSVGVCTLVLAAVAGWNYFGVYRPVEQVITNDTRNEHLKLWAYYQHALVPSVLVVDLRAVSEEMAPIDAMRALFQSASVLKERSFEKVILSFRGTPKLMLEGPYFKKLGVEFGQQNPVYTIRTLPENVRRLDGTPAYSTWTGGWIGVMGKQMEDVTAFSTDWYIAEMAAERPK